MAVEEVVQNGQIDHAAADRIAGFYESALNGSTYLEPTAQDIPIPATDTGHPARRVGRNCPNCECRSIALAIEFPILTSFPS